MNIKFSIYFVTTLMTLVANTVTVSASNNDTENKSVENQKTTTQTEINKNAKKRSSVKTLEEFVPSEEVSADKPVAFPTDI